MVVRDYHLVHLHHLNRPGADVPGRFCVTVVSMGTIDGNNFVCAQDGCDQETGGFTAVNLGLKPGDVWWCDEHKPKRAR